MALNSMTGFGRGQAASEGWRVDIELSSVNRKQFDLSLSLPRDLSALEARLQAKIHERIRRGHVKGTLRVQSAATLVGIPNADLARLQIAALRQLAGELGLRDDLSASTLLRLQSSSSASDAAAPVPDQLWPLVESALDQALDALVAMRQAEGASLAEDLKARVGVLRDLVAVIRARAPQVAADYRAALLRRLGEAGVPVPLDDPSLLRELALFADRCDISEELTRLQSHFAQTDDLLASHEPCGRAFDFLCQELFREINTAGSKANDAPLATLVIRFKAELEALREQVQNVE